MARLPPHHINRSRLTDACDAELVVVVEAGAGYGKTVLAAELVEHWGAVPVEVVLEETGVSAELLAGRLRAAVARAGYSEAVADMTAAGEDPAGAIDAMVGSLTGAACAIVIDDFHNATRQAAQLVDRIAGAIGPPQRLVVLARALPPGSERLRRADAVALGVEDLALRADEALELCRTGFQLDVTDEDARVLTAVTGGWTAAAVLAVSRAKRTARPLREVTAGETVGRTARAADPMWALLEEVLVALAEHRVALAQIARLPWIDRELVGELTGDANFIDRLARSGLPLAPAGAGWWALPGPVRDRLAALAAPDSQMLARAADHYIARGELSAALSLLLATGELESAARVLGDADIRQLEAVDSMELSAILSRIPGELLERYPRSLLNVALVHGTAYQLGPRGELLARLDAVVDAAADPVLRRAADIELAVDVLNTADHGRAEGEGRRILADAGPGEDFTRGRALTVIGQSLALRRDDAGRISSATLDRGGEYFDRAREILLHAGYQGHAAGIALYQVGWIELPLGRAASAVGMLGDAMALVVDRPRRYVRLLFHRSQALTDLGRHDEAEADLREVRRMALRLHDEWMLAYVPWQRMVIASLTGYADVALAQAREADAQPGQWRDWFFAQFLAEAADDLDRVGHSALATEYLQRAEADPQNAAAAIAVARCALAARHGDADVAAQELEQLDRETIPPREHWRLTLLAAAAAQHRGDPRAGELTAAAFEQAARLGLPELPLVRERGLAESLYGLLADVAPNREDALRATELPLALTLLGAFELARGGRPIDVPRGQPATLLKLVAVGGGTLAAELAIETLWPEVDVAAGRHRLRTVLNRLREAAPDVIARDGELLQLGHAVRVDLHDFLDEAERALALGPTELMGADAIARSAITRYRGELLAGDRYATWIDEPRERARRSMLDLVDLCTDAAIERGDLDEARRLVERTVQIAPDELERYVRVAMILREQGRRGAALSVLARARATLERLGVAPSPQLAVVERSLRA